MRLTKEKRQQWRNEARRQTAWPRVVMEHSDNTDRLLAALDALDEMERERDEARAECERLKRHCLCHTYENWTHPWEVDDG